jgi:hypothetical protein
MRVTVRFQLGNPAASVSSAQTLAGGCARADAPAKVKA